MTGIKPPKDWDKLVQEAEAESPRRESGMLPSARAKIRANAIRTVFVLSLFLLAGVWFGPLNTLLSPPNQQQLIEGKRAALLVAAQALHDYALINDGAYPAKLDEAIVMRANKDIQYTSGPHGFELRLVVNEAGAQQVVRGR